MYFNIISPKLLDFFGRFSPLGVGGIANIALAPFIISRYPMSESSRNHEEIHIAQQYECSLLFGALVGVVGAVFASSIPLWVVLVLFIAGFVPGIGPFYLLYYAFQALLWLYAKVTKKRSPGMFSYRQNPFEREAYAYQKKQSYLDKRPLLAWVLFVGKAPPRT